MTDLFQEHLVKVKKHWDKYFKIILSVLLLTIICLISVDFYYEFFLYIFQDQRSVKLIHFVKSLFSYLQQMKRTDFCNPIFCDRHDNYPNSHSRTDKICNPYFDDSNLHTLERGHFPIEISVIFTRTYSRGAYSNTKHAYEI